MEAGDYEDYRKKMRAKSEPYEDFVFDALQRRLGITVVRYLSKEWQYNQGECSGGIEVKFDDQRKNTNNLYIEKMEKAVPDPNRPYVWSGIYRSDNSWLYAIGDYDVLYIFSIGWLRWVDKHGDVVHVTKSTSKGFLLPEIKGRKWACKILNFKEGRSK